ncbi:response regulator transcription factor [Pelagibius marinus]|uniref:response regulator transcription factor n=1 Tax=Pelagibius marinus TaxID=2762760 RepID=UPI001872D7DB|nr:LuxR family transcriptional regulator [Pelagibius marinus]
MIKPSDELGQGRRSYDARAWRDAFEYLSRADEEEPLRAEDLERFAVAAYLTGEDDRFLEILGRAYKAYLDADQPARALRCAFWIGLTLLLRGETGRGTGWISGAQRLMQREGLDCVEQGYLLLPSAEQSLGGDDFDTASKTAAEALEIGERFGDIDLIACARHVQGRVLMGQGQVEQGLACLDEAMVAVTSGDLFPMMTGLVYCSVIDACQQFYALARAWEWTTALASWCAEQPQMVAFTSSCLIHRSEIMTLHGAWSDAIEEAQRACESRTARPDTQQPAAAFYRQAEVHRLRGEFALAEEGYRSASRRGFEPQPGLALLRLAQGDTVAAAAAIRRIVDATSNRPQRAKLLPAYVEIMLAAKDIEAARGACRELAGIAEGFKAEAMEAMAAHARGTVDLAEDDATAALGSLRQALEAWQRLEAPYELARARVAAGLACRVLGDDEGANLEFDAARDVFERLGAAPDLRRVAALTGEAADRPSHGLTPRERQVLSLVAIGKTNKAIAAELGVSGRTVERHVSNIFNKLDVPSRAAATAFAYEHDLI